MTISLTASTVSIRELIPGDGPALSVFFQRLESDPGSQAFRPHPLTSPHAEQLCRDTTKDHYAVALCNGEIVGYGMLRGWQEGFDVPSLGIAVLPSARGKGLARQMMNYLHLVAASRSAKQIRLRVEPSNEPALGLYHSMGYQPSGFERGQILMLRSISRETTEGRG